MSFRTKASKFWKKNKTAVVISLGLIALLGVFAYIAFAGLAAPPTPGPTGEFDVIGWDGSRGLELPGDSFDYTLYGVTGNDLSDFGNFEVVESGTSLGDISLSDLDPADYDNWVVKADGQVAADWWDVDDPGVEDVDTTYDHNYYARWFVISRDTTNYLIFYEQPSTANFSLMNSQTAGAITMPIVGKTNVTIIAFTNMTQTHARYVTGPNYENEDNDQPSIILVFNKTVSLNWITINGATKTRVNDTAIRFSFGVLSSTPTFFNMMWGDDADRFIRVNQVSLKFGDSLLASKV